MDLDNNLIKEILSVTKEKASGDTWVELQLSGYEDADVTEHVRLLDEQGYIEAIDLSKIGNVEWKPKRLTVHGHQYLENLNQSIFSRFKQRFASHTENIAVSAITSAITAIITIMITRFLQ
ncbi:MAG: DUF2513 domain-containing protein [Alphaproteobacteria bacterium]